MFIAGRCVRRYCARMRYSLIVLMALLAACGKSNETPETPPLLGGSPPPDPHATFTRVQSEVLTPSCSQLGCHDAQGHQEGLVLTPGVAWANMVGIFSHQQPDLQLIKP